MHPKTYAATTPDKPALIDAATGETVTYRALDRRSNQGAHLFRRLGLGPRDHLAILMENSPRYFEAVWAAQRAGIHYTPISTRLSAAETDYIVRDCEAKVLVVSHGLAPLAHDLRNLLPPDVHIYLSGAEDAALPSWERALDGEPTSPIADETAGWPMFYSSGTTGRPKGIVRMLPDMPVDAPLPTDEIGRRQYGWSPDTIYLSPAPLYHAAPLVFNTTVMRNGGTCVIMDHFDAERALQLIEKYKITHSQWVPTMFVRMLKLPDDVRRKYDLSTHKIAIHAAAPCPVKVKHQMIDWWGPILVEYYAGSEGNGSTFINSADWLKHPGSVGRPAVSKVHILDDDFNDMPAGQAGTIYFEGGGAYAYHKDPAKTDGAKSPQGWTTLGDVGYLDEEGYLYLTDRKAFMIISGGVNIYPQEAENILITHPKVADVAVIGVPNEEFGEEVKAVVQPMDWAQAGPDLAAELIAHCRSQISALKCPRTVDFERELPRHPTGKLYKRLIRDRYWGKTDTTIV